jgi:hypothetical protein
MPDPIAVSDMSEAQCNYSKYILLLLIIGGGHFRITMTVDKDMEFEKKGLRNSENVMDFFALGGVQTLKHCWCYLETSVSNRSRGMRIGTEIYF